MNRMTDYQRKLVENNVNLVDKVITFDVRVTGQILMTREDFYQVGCEALCRAAMAYHPEVGTFGTLARKYIYNAIIDHCRKQNKVNGYTADITDENGDNQFLFDATPVLEDIEDQLYAEQIQTALATCKEQYSGIILRGIEAMELKSLGYSTREIADRYDSTINNVNAWISRARSELRKNALMRQFQPEF